MKRACPYCGRIHDRHNACGRAPVYRKGDTEANRLRGKRAWRKVKQLANDRDGHLCELCLGEGVICMEGLETHHIVPIAEAPELAFAVDNLVTLCRRHHEYAEGIPPGELRQILERSRNRRAPAGGEIFRKPGDRETNGGD